MMYSCLDARKDEQFHVVCRGRSLTFSPFFLDSIYIYHSMYYLGGKIKIQWLVSYTLLAVGGWFYDTIIHIYDA